MKMANSPGEMKRGKFRILIRNAKGRLVQEFSVEDVKIQELSSGTLRLIYTPTHRDDPDNGVSGVLGGRLYVPNKMMITILDLEENAVQMPFSGLTRALLPGDLGKREDPS